MIQLILLSALLSVVEVVCPIVLLKHYSHVAVCMRAVQAAKKSNLCTNNRYRLHIHNTILCIAERYQNEISIL